MTTKAQAFFIGVDGGGTNTRMLLVDHQGRKRGEGHAGSTNRNDHAAADVLANMQKAFDACISDLPAGSQIGAMALGLGGVCTNDDKADVEKLVRGLKGLAKTAVVHVANDTAIGLTGGLSGRPGLVLIAGTGSACYGRNKSGQEILAGGWGPLVDDVGGGYWIGLQAMIAAVRAEDGRLGAKTSLQSVVFSALGLSDPRAFLDRVHNRKLERAEIAALAPQVVEAAGNQDAPALAILQRGADELADLVAVTAEPLFKQEPCDLILVGGLALSGPPYQDLITKAIARKAPQVTLREPEMSPVHGAALQALHEGGIEWTAELLAQVRGS